MSDFDSGKSQLTRPWVVYIFDKNGGVGWYLTNGNYLSQIDKADADSLYQVKGDYEVAGTAAGLNDAMDLRVKALEAIDHEKLATDASATAVANCKVEIL